MENLIWGGCELEFCLICNLVVFDFVNFDRVAEFLVRIGRASAEIMMLFVLEVYCNYFEFDVMFLEVYDFYDYYVGM